jgi:hypothetical protein
MLSIVLTLLVNNMVTTIPYIDSIVTKFDVIIELLFLLVPILRVFSTIRVFYRTKNKSIEKHGDTNSPYPSDFSGDILMKEGEVFLIIIFLEKMTFTGIVFLEYYFVFLPYYLLLMLYLIIEYEIIKLKISI